MLSSILLFTLNNYYFKNMLTLFNVEFPSSFASYSANLGYEEMF